MKLYNDIILNRTVYPIVWKPTLYLMHLIKELK